MESTIEVLGIQQIIDLYKQQFTSVCNKLYNLEERDCLLRSSERICNKNIKLIEQLQNKKNIYMVDTNELKRLKTEVYRLNLYLKTEKKKDLEVENQKIEYNRLKTIIKRKLNHFLMIQDGWSFICVNVNDKIYFKINNIV